MGRQFVRVLVAFAIIGVVVSSGCKRKNVKTGLADGDILHPGAFEGGGMAGGLGMGDERFGGGIPVAEQFAAVYFAYDNYQINPAEVSKIEQVSTFMQQNADVKLIAEGHCDERGSRDYNMALGENRAQAVRAYLVSLGVSGDRVQTSSYGAERPIDPGHGESSWQLNRRVEFALFR